MRFLWDRPALLAGLIVLAAALLWAVGSARAAEPIKEGDKAPDITLAGTQVDKALPGQAGKTLHLKDLQGKKNVVVYFFPKALTGG